MTLVVAIRDLSGDVAELAVAIRWWSAIAAVRAAHTTSSVLFGSAGG